VSAELEGGGRPTSWSLRSTGKRLHVRVIPPYEYRLRLQCVSRGSYADGRRVLTEDKTSRESEGGANIWTTAGLWADYWLCGRDRSVLSQITNDEVRKET
jgi:hypothetical protein